MKIDWNRIENNLIILERKPKNKKRGNGYENLVGCVFNELLVIEESVTKNNKTYWKCKCSCGKEIIVGGAELRTGQKSCGCIKARLPHAITHGKSKTRLYSIWLQMKKRCYNKNNKDYDGYGKRGIIICDEWLNDFMVFYDWAMNNGYSNKLSIDRINNDGNYEPNNCKFSTNIEQANNKRNTLKKIEYNGVVNSISEWSRLTGISYDNIKSRLKLGWTIEKALTRKNKKDETI